MCMCMPKCVCMCVYVEIVVAGWTDKYALFVCEIFNLTRSYLDKFTSDKCEQEYPGVKHGFRGPIIGDDSS